MFEESRGAGTVDRRGMPRSWVMFPYGKYKISVSMVSLTTRTIRTIRTIRTLRRCMSYMMHASLFGKLLACLFLMCLMFVVAWLMSTSHCSFFVCAFVFAILYTQWSMVITFGIDNS